MFHELIYALHGVSGGVFKFDGKCFMICPELLETPIMHLSIYQVLKDILSIATGHKRIIDYLEKRKPVPSSIKNEKIEENQLNKATEEPFGLFVKSTCSGIREILGRYLDVVAELEYCVMEDPYLTATEIKCRMEPFRGLFDVLNSLLSKMESQRKSSAVIVEIVKSHFDTNIPLQDDLKILIPWVNKILYKFITNWVVFGSLYDPYDEFFIKQKTIEQFAKKEGKNKLSILTTHSKVLEKKSYVDFSVVPSHFNPSLTDKILFIGYAVGILQQSKKSNSFLSKQNHFFEKMEALSVATFRTEDLDDAIDELAVAVGKDLHYLVVTETDLQKHLGIVKEFYLTGRGELFHDFLLNLKDIPFSKLNLNSDIQQAFALAAGRVQMPEEILQKIKISVNRSNNSECSSLSSCIENMTLTMEHEWPLEVLFTPECIEKYNELFIFLLQVRRLQMDLNSIWVSTRKVFRFPIPQGPAELRNIMSYFIDHLQHFLQEDVLEHQFSVLSDTIAKSDNFEQIRVAHTKFQSSILNQSFRSMRQLRRILDEIIGICSKFVDFVNSCLDISEKNNIPINEGITNEVLEFSTQFKRYTDLLLSLLNGAATNPQSGQYLAQFLLRLDFNCYFSSVISVLNIPKK